MAGRLGRLQCSLCRPPSFLRHNLETKMWKTRKNIETLNAHAKQHWSNKQLHVCKYMVMVNLCSKCHTNVWIILTFGQNASQLFTVGQRKSLLHTFSMQQSYYVSETLACVWWAMWPLGFRRPSGYHLSTLSPKMLGIHIPVFLVYTGSFIYNVRFGIFFTHVKHSVFVWYFLSCKFLKRRTGHTSRDVIRFYLSFTVFLMLIFHR